MDFFDQPLSLMFSGAFAAVLAFGIFYANARLLCRDERWPLALLGIVGLAGGVLSLCAFGARLFLIPLVLSLLVLGASASLVLHLRRGLLGRGDWSFSRGEWLAVLLLLLQLMWAASPYYRYDQWNYHLVIAKYILALGHLPAHIFDDHIFFSGIYEYLFLLPRWLVPDDLFVASFADAFTWILVLGLSWGAIQLAKARFGWTAPSLPILLFFVMLALPHQHSLNNAKSESLLVLCSLMALLLWPFPDSEKVDQLLFGWILAWPLALKVTWLHGAFVISVVFAVETLRRKAWRMIPYVAVGAGVGLLMSASFFAKNFHFFGNPLHPVQAGPFKSWYWNEAMAAHWQSSTGAAHDLQGYAGILFGSLPRVFAETLWPYVLLVCFFGLWNLREGCWKLEVFKSCNVRDRSMLPAALLVIMFFVLSTPWMLDPKVQARFALPLVGLLFVFCLWAIAWTTLPRKWINGALLVAGLVAGSWDVTVRKLYELVQSGSIERHYHHMGPPYHVLLQAKAVNRHRAQYFPESSPDAYVVGGTDPAKYFYDSLFVNLRNYDFVQLQAEFNQNRKHHKCILALLKELRIAYLVIESEYEIKIDPAILRLQAKYGVKLPGADGVFFISPQALERATQDREICHSSI